jgi:hypothetical protein
MRRSRWLAPWKNSRVKPVIYHCVSRVVERRFALGDVEREQFRIYMRMYENFTGCRVLSYNRQRQPYKERTLLANVPNIKNISVELFGVSACGFAHWEPNISKMNSYKRTYEIGPFGGAKRISSFENGIHRIVTPTITKY